MTRTRLILLALAACAVLALSGCVVLVAGTTTAAQQDVIGPVALSTVVCASDTSATYHAGCQDGNAEGADGNGNSDTESEDENLVYQLLAGYRVPSGSQGPPSFAADGPADTTLTFTRSASLTSELERLAPAGSGLRWIGYLSISFEYDGDVDNLPAGNQLGLAPAFTLPQGPGGAPFQGPFVYRATIGMRVAQGDAPVNCGTSLTTYGTGTPTDSICVDSPAPGALGSSITLATRDLGIVASSEPTTVTAGEQATLGYSAQYAGSATPDASFDLAASASAPGATATPSQATLVPAGDSATPLSATVNVPASTPPGSYSVTLTASLPNGQTRAAARTLEVVAPAPPPPTPPDTTKPTLKTQPLKGQTVRSIMRNGLRVKLTLNEPGRVVTRLKLGRRPLSALKTFAFARAGSRTATVWLTRKALGRRSRSALLAPARLHPVLRSTATDAAGNASRWTTSLTLKRGRSAR